MLDASGKPGLNYLCAGYQRYFRHLPPYLKAMADLLAHGRPASDIMQAHLLVVNSKKAAILWPPGVDCRMRRKRLIRPT